MATTKILDADGVERDIENPLAPGRVAAAASHSVALSTEDKAVLDALATAANQAAQTTLLGAVTETAPGSDTASSGLNGRLQRIAQHLSTLLGYFRAEDAASADGHIGLPILAQRQATPANSSGTDGDYESLRIDGGSLWAKLTSVNPGSAATNLGKNVDATAGGTDTGVAALSVRTDTLATVTPAVGDYLVPRVNARGAAWVAFDYTEEPGITTVNVVITRAANTTPYDINDVLASSTAETGGSTLTNVVRAAGKSCRLTDMVVISSAAPTIPLEGEVFLFDTAVTAVNDLAAFTVTDAERATEVARIPFALETLGANSSCHIRNIDTSILTVGSANLRALFRVTNAYVPVSGEVITFRFKFAPVN